MAKPRASIFDESAKIDLSDFTPKPKEAPPGPAPEKVRAVSEAANFPSREPAARKTSAKPTREPRRYRTGRSVQFNCKASQETIDGFYAICDKQGWVLGYTLERAVAALSRELKKS